jgi:hypothetical protein
MHSRLERPPSQFTAPERYLIRRELGVRFTTYPSIADGILLRTWRAGPQAGQPKLPPAIQSMVQRGLVEVRAGGHPRLPRAFFTEAGVDALRELAQDRRALDPLRFAHVRRELGLDKEGNETGPIGESGLHDAERL